MKTTKTDLQFGDIILINYPTLGKGKFKKRPFLVLQEDQDDILSCTISSRLDQQNTQDIILRKDNKNKLATDSVLKMNKITPLHKNLLHKKIGSLEDKDKKVVKHQLIEMMKAL